MSSVETRKFEPTSGTAVNLGASGDAVTLPAGVTLQTNTIKDAGGNTIFTSDGAGNLSSVNSGLQGNMVFISSQTASSSASIEFTSGIDSTYDEYVFYFVNLHPGTHAENFTFQVNAVGGSGFDETITSTSFEVYHTESDSSAGMGYNSSYDQAQGTAYQILHYSVSGGAGYDDNGLVGELHLFAPSSTTYVKQFYCVANTMVGATQTEVFTAGYFNTTSALDEISFKMSSGNIDAGTIYLYGIK